MNMRVIRKAIGLLIVDIVIIIGIFILQFRTDSSILKKIGNLQVSMARTEEAENTEALQNKLEISYNGITLHTNDQDSIKIIQKDEQVDIDKGNGFDLHPLSVDKFFDVPLPAGQRVDHRMRDRDRLPADQGADTSCKEVAGKCRDEGRNVQIVDRSTLQQTESDADDQCDEHAQCGMVTQYRRAVGHNHTCEAGYGCDRQVNAAGDEHHGHADCRDAVVGVVLEHVDERTQCRKADVAVTDRAVGVDQNKDTNGGVYHDELWFQQPAREGLPLFGKSLRHVRHPPSLSSFRAWPCAGGQVRTGAQ